MPAASGFLQSVIKHPNPLPFTLGVEYEVCIPRENRTSFDLAVRDTLSRYCDVKGDGSIAPDREDLGRELATHPYSEEAFIRAQAIVGHYLNQVDAYVNNSCGLHVHVDGSILNASAKDRIRYAWDRHQAIFLSLCAPHRRSNSYCRSGYAPESEGDRYRMLNMLSMQRHGTIEYRLKEGTVNTQEASAWAILLGLWQQWAAGQRFYTKSVKIQRTYTAERLARFLHVTSPPLWVWRTLRPKLQEYTPDQFARIVNRKLELPAVRPIPESAIPRAAEDRSYPSAERRAIRDAESRRLFERRQEQRSRHAQCVGNDRRVTWWHPSETCAAITTTDPCNCSSAVHFAQGYDSDDIYNWQHRNVLSQSHCQMYLVPTGYNTEVAEMCMVREHYLWRGHNAQAFNRAWRNFNVTWTTLNTPIDPNERNPF